MAREDLHFRLRIPEDLKQRIESAAELNMRSMTAEIVERLRYTFGPVDKDMEGLLDTIHEREREIGQLKASIEIQKQSFEQLKEIFEIHKHVVDAYRNIVDRTEDHVQRLATLIRNSTEAILDPSSPATDREVAMAKAIFEAAHQMDKAHKDAKTRKRYADEIMDE